MRAECRLGQRNMEAALTPLEARGIRADLGATFTQVCLCACALSTVRLFARSLAGLWEDGVASSEH